MSCILKFCRFQRTGVCHSNLNEDCLASNNQKFQNRKCLLNFGFQEIVVHFKAGYFVTLFFSKKANPLSLNRNYRKSIFSLLGNVYSSHVINPSQAGYK